MIKRTAVALAILALPMCVGADWHLVWSDEFNAPAGTPPDASKWTYDIGGGGWGNQELEVYTNRRDNVFQDGEGHLVIRAIKTQSGGYTSARLKTQGKFAIRYGRIEARMKIPFGQGMWPAFWMLGDDIDTVDWPKCGEIDVMESIGKEPSLVHGTVHGPGYSGAGGITAQYALAGSPPLADDFHVYAAEWSPDLIEFFIDGFSYARVTPASLPKGAKWVYDHPFFLLLNLAVGGAWPGNPDASSQFPQSMLVDWVRVSQAAGNRHIPQEDSSYIDPDGTAHIARVVPVPDTISSEAQQELARQVSDAPVHESLAERRSKTDTWQARAGAEFRKLYPVNVEEQSIAGVPVRVITPLHIADDKRDRVLINVHGGGFNSDSGSLTETVPIANLTGMKVVAVLYRLAPEHPFPAAVEDTVAVYKELLKTYRPERIGLFGTSAGAVLTAEVAAQLRKSGLPLPAALGIFSGFGDFSKTGDSRAIYALNGFSGPLTPPSKTAHPDNAYIGAADPKDPVLSPLYADLHGFPPALFITSTRDLLLSGTTILHRAYLRAGVDARLVVFEALPHAFWNNPHLPETKEANEIMARFFDQQLGR